MDTLFGSWRLDYRDYAGHKAGSPPPSRQCRRFKHREAALADLKRLRAMPGAEIVGCITPVPPKSAASQGEFGFPFGGPRRMTS
jgi:hypothetical protein